MSVSGAAEIAGPCGQAKASACLSPAAAGSPSTLEVDTRLRPGIAPWLTLSTSWRAVDAAASRFDLVASTSFGIATRLAIDSGLRLIPEGRRFKGCVSVERAAGGLELSASIRTAGWIDTEGDWSRSLEYAIKVTATLR